jgi:uncharacterized repeat protein (TIGR03803 family)
MKKKQFMLGWGVKACGVFLLWAMAAVALTAQTFTTLHSFDGTDGSDSRAVLVQGTNGDFYGTTVSGGADDGGTVFKITTGGTLITVHHFCSQGGSDCSDGFEPFVGLLLGTDGNFYGTTDSGGDAGFYGTIFKITPIGTLTTLHAFNGGGTQGNGAGPVGGLVQATNGNFYGTTEAGGTDAVGNFFEITPSGTLTVIYSFGTDGGLGDYPEASLVQGTDGNFYGTTYEGGPNRAGTVFKITPSGTFTTLHSFDTADGASPVAGLIQATNGNFYGTTPAGGANGAGTVFTITPSGTLTTLYNFCAQGGASCTDGDDPFAGLVQATDGNFYGTTQLGGVNGAGTIFKITPSGTLTTLHSFEGATDGNFSQAGLLQATNGTLYGTTTAGGANSAGTVFSLAVGLGPFVRLVPGSGKVGATVTILGTNLTGATSVTFNGTAAAFTVVSASHISATVPTGATTGSVVVTTPRGSLTSNVKFVVP